MNKKIVFFLYDLSMGGTEKVAVRLSNYLVKKGYEVEILLVSNNNVFLSEIDHKVKVTSFNLIKISQSIIPLIQFLKKKNYDFFLSNVWPLTIVSVIAFLFLPSQLNKLILIEHCHLREEWKEKSFFFKFFQRMSIKFLYNLSKQIISVSEGVSEDLISKGVKQEKTKVIYNPAFSEPDLFIQKLPEKVISWSQSKEIKIISVGNFKTQKNYPNLIKSIDILKNDRNIACKLLIVGDGPRRAEIEEMVIEKNLNKDVCLLGQFNAPLNLINLADLFVLPSDYEGFGLVIVEALSLGKTVVSTNCKSGPAEIIGNNKYGYLCKVNDPKDLAEKIEYAINHKMDEEILIKRAKDFSVENIGIEYENIFN
tara:strand:+ start:32004 stop:33104 length:1101 start_codon:yes stop_codon:yes gene_type:complete